MALDGIMLSLVKEEILSVMRDAHISQVYQPSKDELVLAFRSQGVNRKLFISCRADCARVHFTDYAPENPQTPPMLCMLLRKRLCKARLVDIRQPQFERILMFDFDCTTEVGDKEQLTLIVEIMGRYSNIILTDSNGYVIDAYKRVDISMTSGRVVLPKIPYELPPQQDKLSITDGDMNTIVSQIINSDKPVDKAILSVVQGVSPIITRELEYKVAMADDEAIGLKTQLENIRQLVHNNTPTPTIVLREDNSVMDVAFMDIEQYKGKLKVVHYETFSKMLDAFYYKRDMAMRMKARSQDLHKLCANAVERLSKKINIQTLELKKCMDREGLRIKGDLVQANLYRIQRGAACVVVENFYEEGSPKLVIELDPSISPAQNAQKFYKAYAKAKTAQQMLTVQIEKAKQELSYVISVQDFLNRAESDKELSQIRLELVEQGYIKEKRNLRQKLLKALPPLEYKTTDGYTVYVGRNNKQNDTLTLKTAKKTDLWFHTKEIPGSHTILVTQGDKVSDTAIYEAAQICAYHSKAKDSSQVPVDYTQVKFVSKPQGAKPGKVIYVNNHTVYVTPKLPTYEQ